jgi:hypothetical protein
MSDFACDLSAFTAEQRAGHVKLTASLARDISEVKELENGYAFKIGEGENAFEKAAEWISLENRCCPFLCFHLEWVLEKPVWVHVTGPKGIKPFISNEMKLG